MTASERIRLAATNAAAIKTAEKRALQQRLTRSAELRDLREAMYQTSGPCG